MTEVTDPALWWKQAVVYQVYPRSFKDSRGEGLGQIAGVTEKIDYLKDLASTPSGSVRSIRPSWPTVATTWTITATSTRSSEPWMISTNSPRPHMHETSRSWSTSCRITAPICTNGSRPPSQPNRDRRSVTAISSATARGRMAISHRPTGRTISAARHGPACPTPVVSAYVHQGTA